MAPSDQATDAPVQEHRFPCDNCGADFRFDPGARKLICDHCGNTAAMDTDAPQAIAPIAELDYRAALPADLPAAEIEETRVFR